MGAAASVDQGEGFDNPDAGNAQSPFEGGGATGRGKSLSQSSSGKYNASDGSNIDSSNGGGNSSPIRRNSVNNNRTIRSEEPGTPDGYSNAGSNNTRSSANYGNGNTSGGSATPNNFNKNRPSFNAVDDDGADDDNPLDILFQFIPYYGQGDPGNDTIVRSTLSALGIEDIDKKDAFGNTLLLLACQYRCEDLARIILNKGADPNAVNQAGACCLHFTCYKESASKSLAKILLQNGANPEVAESTYGCTPLHYCAGTGDVDFCKMLISYGANVGTYDYYNYTCVDYAREAGMAACAQFLQSKLLEQAASGGTSFRVSSQVRGGGSKFGAAASSYRQLPLIDGEWQIQFDGTTGQKYYTSLNTGEWLWEKDFLARKNSSSSPSAKGSDDRYLLLGEESAGYYGYGAESADPKTPVGGDSPDKKESLVPQPTKANLRTTSMNNMDPAVLQALLNEAKMKSEQQLEAERAENRALISNKDGQIAKLQAVVETMTKDNAKIEEQCKNLKSQLDRISQSGGQALRDSEQEVERLRSEVSALKAQVTEAEYARSEEVAKLEALQNTLSNLTSNESERVEMEQRAAEKRAEEQREREAKFAVEVKALNQTIADERMRFAQEFAMFKMDRDNHDREVADRNEAILRSKEKEIDKLNIEMADTRAKAAQELSNLQMLVEVANKKVAESEARADEAHIQLRAMQADIEEARVIQQFNAQLHRDLTREQNARKKLHNEMEDLKGKIRVYVRIRPMSNTEIERSCAPAVIKDGKLSVLVLGANGEGSKKVFDFDQVFGGSEGNSQPDVFKDTKHLIMSVVDGYNVCIFAYGQTGSGKTFTMIGASDLSTCIQPNGDFDELAGVTPRAVSELFRILNERSAQVTYEVEVQMFQLYRDALDDLLADPKKKKDGKPLKIILAEHSSTGLVQVEGAESMIATTPADVIEIFSRGSSRRATASTQMNAESSRSHLICCLVVKLTNRRTGVQSLGKLTLVDLAGSERVDKSGAVGEVLKEAQSINKSLSALGDVIASLTSNAAHVPYRNHPLTMLMSDSLGGNAKTLMFVNCSPADYNVAESNSSLSFATRCKDITNAVSAPPAVQAAQLSALKKELAKLKKDQKPGGGGGGKVGGGLARPV